MGKDAVNETLSNYQGVYAGSASNLATREHFEGSSLILSTGAFKVDINTGCFSSKAGKIPTIEINSTSVVGIDGELHGSRMKGVLRRLIENARKLYLEAPLVSLPQPASTVPGDSKQKLTHSWFWPQVGEFLKDNDIVVTDAGTSNFGIWGTRFPKGVIAVNQIHWSSIGFSLGACQGAAMAAKDGENQQRRTELFIGDGSLQLTAQELSTIIRHKLTPTM